MSTTESVRVAVVDDRNRFVRWAHRPEIHAARLPHRSVQVLLFDPDGRLVLQRRARTKATHPGYWDASASGHVEEPDYFDPAKPDDRLDEVYDAVAVRELAEELGVVAPLERLGAFAPLPGVHYEHYVLYRGVSAGPFRAQPEEVEEVRAFDSAGFDALVASGDLVTESVKWLVRWARDRGLF
jgi:isopentenyldiphosphate isomerase